MFSNILSVLFRFNRFVKWLENCIKSDSIANEGEYEKDCIETMSDVNKRDLKTFKTTQLLIKLN